MSPLSIALIAMFLQQTFPSVGKVLPAVIAPLVLAELGTDPAWVGVYFLSNQRRGSGGEPIPMRSSRPVGWAWVLRPRSAVERREELTARTAEISRSRG